MFLQGRHIGGQTLGLGLCCREAGDSVSKGLHLALQLGIGRCQFGGAGTHLGQAAVQFGGLTRDAQLLLALFLQLGFELLDLQLQRFAAVVHIGFAGHDLAGNRLQAPRRFLADAGKAFLGGNQLLAHQGNLLEAPPGQARKGDQQRTDQCPQRTSAGALDLDHGRRSRTHRRRGGRHEIIVIPKVGPQAGNVVEVVFSIVTHESTLNQ